MVKLKVLLISFLLAFVAVGTVTVNAQPVAGAAAYWPMDVRDVPANDTTPGIIGGNTAGLFGTDGASGAGANEPVIGPGGKVGNALWLDNTGNSHASGTMQFAAATDAGSGDILVGASDCTWSWWYNEDTAKTTGETVFLENLSTPAGSPGYTIYQLPDASGDDLQVYINGAGASFGAHVFTDGQWSHNALTRTNLDATDDKYTWYIDGAVHGIVVMATAGQIIDGSNQIHMGTRQNGTWAGQEQGIGGGIDEVLLYKRALDIQEIQTLSAVPEPMTMCLLGLGGLALIRRRK